MKEWLKRLWDDEVVSLVLMPWLALLIEFLGIIALIKYIFS